MATPLVPYELGPGLLSRGMMAPPVIDGLGLGLVLHRIVTRLAVHELLGPGVVLLGMTTPLVLHEIGLMLILRGEAQLQLLFLVRLYLHCHFLTPEN